MKTAATGLTGTRVNSDIHALLNLMYHIARHNPGRAKHWWIRLGNKDSDNALTVVGRRREPPRSR
ncbi:hypothetical protein [Streptomyces sp. NPDC055105]|uniref:hypothetical protein n=1 Tax=Streptomyces sp. NPDC055105 TaxID=3365719 RepID=UPI0037CF4BAE